MESLKAVYEIFDTGDFDCRNKDELNKIWQEAQVDIANSRDKDTFHLSEIDRQSIMLNKDFRIDSQTGKIKGVTWMISGTQTLESGEEIPMVWPDISTFKEEDYVYVEGRYNSCQNLHLKTEYGLILYFQQPTLFSKRKDYKQNLCKEMIERAKLYFAKSKIESKEFIESDFLRVIHGALYIASHEKLPEEIVEISAILIETHKNFPLGHKATLRIHAEITSIIADFYRDLKEVVNFEEIIIKNAEAEQELSKSNLWGANSIVEQSLKLAQKSGLPSVKLKRRIGQIFELLGEKDQERSCLAAISHVEKALRIYKSIGDLEKVKKLEAKYGKIRGKGEFSEIKVPFSEDVVTKFHEWKKNEIATKSGEQLIGNLIITPMFPPLEIVNTSKETFREGSIFFPFSAQLVADKFGNTIEKFVTPEEKEEFLFWQSYGFHFQLGVQFLCEYFIDTMKTDKLDEKIIVEYLNKTWLNDPIIRSTAKGPVSILPIGLIQPPLRLFFDSMNRWRTMGDSEKPNFISIVDSLVTKIEAVLRYMCEKTGIASFRLRTKNGNEIVMEKNLDEILSSMAHTTEQITNFDEEDRIFLKYIFTEKMGYNLRNKVAHGLLDSEEYNPEQAILCIVSLLKLSKYQFSTERIAT